MPLTAAAVSKAKPREKTYRLYDERGLYLEVSPSGGKWWRFKYRFDGKEKRLSLGTYSDIGLKSARERRDDARKQVANGIDPSAVRKAVRDAREEQAANSFELVAREWHAKFSPNWSADHAGRIWRRLERFVIPYVGAMNIADVTAPALLSLLRRVESKGRLETAHRTRADCGQVFRYAIATGRAERDPSVDLKGALPPVKSRHHASITDTKEIGPLLRAIDGYSGQFVTLCALRLAPYVFVRPVELRRAEWKEIDLDGREWRIPPERMKVRVLHIVPLSAQAVTILRELQPLTGHGRFVFPGIRSTARPMSENTVNAALRRLGYAKDEMTGHGFRSMASTLLNEQGWNRDAIERQLAHVERNDVRAAYNYAEHLPERRKMMQAWADYLDGLRVGGDIVPLRAARGE